MIPGTCFIYKVNNYLLESQDYIPLLQVHVLGMPPWYPAMGIWRPNLVYAGQTEFQTIAKHTHTHTHIHCSLSWPEWDPLLTRFG